FRRAARAEGPRHPHARRSVAPVSRCSERVFESVARVCARAAWLMQEGAARAIELHAVHAMRGRTARGRVIPGRIYLSALILWGVLLSVIVKRFADGNLAN